MRGYGAITRARLRHRRSLGEGPSRGAPARPRPLSRARRRASAACAARSTASTIRTSPGARPRGGVQFSERRRAIVSARERPARAGVDLPLPRAARIARGPDPDGDYRAAPARARDLGNYAGGSDGDDRRRARQGRSGAPDPPAASPDRQRGADDLRPRPRRHHHRHRRATSTSTGSPGSGTSTSATGAPSWPTRRPRRR